MPKIYRDDRSSEYTNFLLLTDEMSATEPFGSESPLSPHLEITDFDQLAHHFTDHPDQLPVTELRKYADSFHRSNDQRSDLKQQLISLGVRDPDSLLTIVEESDLRPAVRKTATRQILTTRPPEWKKLFLGLTLFLVGTVVIYRLALDHCFDD